MSHLKNHLLAGAALLALPAVASAQPAEGFFDGFRLAPQQTVSGLYIGAGAGANFTNNTQLRSDSSLAAGLAANGIGGRGRAVFETGWTGVASLGWGFGNGLRVEVEGNFRQNDFDKVNRVNGANLNGRAGGFQRTYGAMANALYDFRIPGVPWFVPYVGGGVGYAWRDWDPLRVNGPDGAAISNTSRGGFAYQAIGGAAFPIASVPGLAITAEYRYFAMEPTDMRTSVINASGATVAAGRIRSVNENHSVLVGLRYAFNQPVPPPPPAPVAVAQPAPARTYLVFFDWDRADLTDRARQIIADAAQNARVVSSTRIEVSGHADRTGTAVYNQRLSVRRAEAVANELVRHGIGRNEITVQGFGFERPLVPTAMGVREPQNRRVEIVLR
ncbi:OmpA family protein [Roseococcus pinisoli]|uniref:OmpA family protein n=1 Tax=Roseococcus pinisoli TaxID=2835040 RepID=A0ABS5QBE4_9PROT|nr:OmpA family protein [Roseococcus pinisoli]MBS7810985.1 OmpA family protein [Roseococcus pinisoli]